MKNSGYEWTDHWQRKFFALFVALCTWVATRESLQTTRTFLNVPVRVINISPDWTICDLGPDGQLPKTVGLVLRGKKFGLNQMLESRNEVVVDAQGLSGPWMQKINTKQIHSNAKIDVSRIVKKVITGEIHIPLTPAISQSVCVSLHEKGSVGDDHYTLVDFIPRDDRQMVFGPEETINELEKKKLVGEIDLSKVDCDQLKWQWERADLSRQFEELSYPYIHPIQYSSPFVKPNSPALRPQQIPERIPRLFFLANLPQTIEGDFPLQINLGELEQIDIQELEKQIGASLYKRGAKWRFRGKVEVWGISGELARLIKEQASIQLTCNLIDATTPAQWSWHLLRKDGLEDRYVLKMREQVSDSANLPEIFLRTRFCRFVKNMELVAKGSTSLALQRNSARLP